MCTYLGGVGQSMCSCANECNLYVCVRVEWRGIEGIMFTCVCVDVVEGVSVRCRSGYVYTCMYVVCKCFVSV